MNRREFIKGAAVTTAAVSAGGAFASNNTEKLALFGGTPIIKPDAKQSAEMKELFAWPIVNEEMRKASDDVLVARKMSGTDIAQEFEKKFAEWQGLKNALVTLNGTTALNTAFYACGVGPGDEVICTSITMWSSCMGVVNLGGTVVFCDVNKDDLCMDPKSFEAHITPRTKAVIVVHVYAAPCDMDEIMRIAKKHNIKVIEDVSHAQGGYYKGKKLGTFGDITAMSLMSGKSFAIGEGGILLTNNDELYHRAIQWSSYARFKKQLPISMWKDTFNVPLGGIKNRLNQCTCAVGIEQLKKYDSECEEIHNAMMYYHDLLEQGGCKGGITRIYPSKYNGDRHAGVENGSTKAGWYASRSIYNPEFFKGISNRAFVEAVNAEICGEKGVRSGCNWPMHWSAAFMGFDIFGNGKPPMSRYLPEGVTPKSLTGKLPVADTINDQVLGDPWFKHFDKKWIEIYAEAVCKVARNIDQLQGFDDSKLKHEMAPITDFKIT